jgi:hypothetical protein
MVSLRECNHGRNPGDYGGTSFQQSYWLAAIVRASSDRPPPDEVVEADPLMHRFTTL